MFKWEIFDSGELRAPICRAGVLELRFVDVRETRVRRLYEPLVFGIVRIGEELLGARVHLAKRDVCFIDRIGWYEVVEKDPTVLIE